MLFDNAYLFLKAMELSLVVIKSKNFSLLKMTNHSCKHIAVPVSNSTE